MPSLMTILQVLLAVVVVAAVAEACPLTARLSMAVVGWSARRRYGCDPSRAAERVEELRALVRTRPGGRLLGLATASGFAMPEVFAAVRTTAVGKLLTVWARLVVTRNSLRYARAFLGTADAIRAGAPDPSVVARAREVL
ncbi:hypothetical protein GCM10029978_060060 [Actinoallomurus acanthiterrae]